MNLRERILALSFLLSTTFTQASPDEEAISALKDVIEKQYKNLVTCDGNQYAIYYTVNAWESDFDSTRGRVPGFPAILEVKGGSWIAIPTELTEADKLNGIEWKGTAGFQITAIRWYPLPGRIETRQEKPGWSEWENPLDTLTAKMQNRKQYWLFAAHMAKKSESISQPLPKWLSRGASASPWEFELIDGLSTTKGITCDDVKKFAGVSETTPSTQRQTSPGPIEHKQENFIWPIEVPTFSGTPPNDYATFGVGKQRYFHAGVDIKSSNLPLDKTRVKAIANGIIEDIFRTSDTKTRCDGVTPFAIRTDNHGFGNTIILKHSDKLYSLYAHLHCVESKLEKGTNVSEGEPIGLMGNSAYEKRECHPESDCNPESTEDRGFGKHLHLEIKKKGILTNPDGPAGKYYAYTKNHPDKYGYLDPKKVIGPWPSTTAAGEPQWIGTLKEDGVVHPLFLKTAEGWATPWPKTSYDEEGKGSREGAVKEAGALAAKMPKVWKLWDAAGKAVSVKTGAVVDSPAHCGSALGLKSDRPNELKPHVMNEPKGLVTSGDLPFVPAEKVGEKDVQGLGLRKVIDPLFGQEGVSISKVHVLRVRGEEALYYFSAERKQGEGPENDRSCFKTKVISGWIRSARGALDLVDRKETLTDCDYKELSSVTPLGVVQVGSKAYVVSERHGYEDVAFHVEERVGSKLKSVAVVDGGGC